MNFPRPAARLYLPVVFVLAVIAALTLRSAPEQASLTALTPFSCLVCGSLGLVDVLLNVLLFVPLGVALRRTGMRLLLVVGGGFAISLAIELLQLALIAGRDASVSDLITNTAGAALGAVLADRWRRLVAPTVPAAIGLVTLYAIAWAALWGGSAALLRPDPPPGRYYGQWAHDFENNRTQWRGTIGKVDLNDHPIPDDLVPDEPLRGALWSRGYTLEVRGAFGPPTDRVAQIFGLATDRGEIFLEWTQYGRDLGFSIRYGPSLIRLRSPIVRFDYAAPTDSGEPLHLIARERNGVLSAEVRTARDTIMARHPLTPSLNWTFALPFAYRLGFETRWLTMLWVGVTLLPLAYWGGLGGSTRVAALAVGGAALAGLGLAPLIGGLRPVAWSEWLGAFCAWVAGSLLARRRRPAPAEILVPGGYPPRARRAASP